VTYSVLFEVYEKAVEAITFEAVDSKMVLPTEDNDDGFIAKPESVKESKVEKQD
jgi:hypothetical protein